LTYNIVEIGTYLIAACLLTYRPLAIYLWRKTPLPGIHADSGPNYAGKLGDSKMPLAPGTNGGVMKLESNGTKVSLPV
jgi:hypothetical protein